MWLIRVKAGDLIETRKGNFAIVINSDHVCHGWSDIVYCETGYFREGFYNGQIRRVVKCK